MINTELTHTELMTLLDDEAVPRSPVYSGFGIEIYQNLVTRTQVVSDYSGTTRLVTVRHGF